MTLLNQFALNLPAPPVLRSKSSAARDSSIEIGCFGGVPLSDRSTESRQKANRMAAICGVEAVSAMRAISTLKALIARYAFLISGGMNASRV